MWALLVSLTVVISLLLYGYGILVNFDRVRDMQREFGNVLLLTAHPDDECMFFGPTLQALRHPTRVHVLCLSTGNAEGLGETRKKELQKSCQVFQLSRANVKAIEHPELQDGMTTEWSPQVIAGVIENHVKKHAIDTIVTFDEHGVSGHPNHKAAFFGAKAFASRSKRRVALYKLVSISLVRKYIGIADLIACKALQTPVLVSSPGDYWMTLKAMRQHVSQLVWFRYLYVSFSRYMFINELKKEDL